MAILITVFVSLFVSFFVAYVIFARVTYQIKSLLVQPEKKQISLPELLYPAPVQPIVNKIKIPNRSIEFIQKPGKNFISVYSAVFNDVGTQNSTLVSVIADTDKEAIKEFEKVLDLNGVSVLPNTKIIAEVKIDIILKKGEDSKKIDNLNSFLQNLMYTRDKFATTIAQKKTLTEIINKISVKHGERHGSQ